MSGALPLRVKRQMYMHDTITGQSKDRFQMPRKMLRQKSRLIGEYMKVEIRPIQNNEITILKEFLYEAIYIPEGVKAPQKDIIERPELRVYTDDFGTKQGDNCFVAVVDNQIVGAVWTRIMNDYGHVDNDTPSFAVSLYKDYRSQGIGTKLMKKMLSLLKIQGYKKASLAVQKANYALSMYEKVGFHTVDENEEEYIMVCEL